MLKKWTLISMQIESIKFEQISFIMVFLLGLEKKLFEVINL